MTMDDTAQLIEDIQAREERLTDWERGFIDSIEKHIRDGRGLTDKQVEKLEAIWERVTAKG